MISAQRLYDMRVALIFSIILLVSTSWAGAQNTPENRVAPRTALPVEGTVELQPGHNAHFAYYYNHNALRDGVLAGNSLIALTESGDLIRFDAATLSMTAQAVVPGRANTIALGGRDRVLVGTQNGQVFNVDSRSLDLERIFSVEGSIAWLAASERVAARKQTIVVVVNNFPEIPVLPGETDKDYGTRQALIQREQHRSFYVATYEEQKVRILPLRLGKKFSEPNSFLLDTSCQLWMGADNGEFGGQFACLDLSTGRMRRVTQQNDGVLGFLRSSDGRIFEYGGMSHMGAHSGYITEIENGRFNTVGEFSRSDWQAPVDEKTQQVFDKLHVPLVIAPENPPREAIDQMIEDAKGGAFWVVSAHILYHTDGQFKHWEKVGELGGMWIGGRRASVGSTPTVNRLIFDQSHPDELLAVRGLDGLERVSGGKVDHLSFAGELGGSVLDIWNTSMGTMFLGDDNDHSAWHFSGKQWQRTSLFPDRAPSEPDTEWYEASPFGRDGGDIFAALSVNREPGESDIVRLDVRGSMNVVHTWENGIIDFDLSYLTTPEDSFLRISGSKIWILQDKVWRDAGESTLPRSRPRMWMLHGRHYIPLAKVKGGELFLDAEYGDIVKLTRTPGPEGRFLFVPVSYQGQPTPSGIFDAFPDRDDNLLIASAHGLVRFHLQDGRSEAIPGPNPGEGIKTLCRDGQGRLWAAGEKLYASSDEGEHWSEAKLPMLAKVDLKRVRPDPTNSRRMLLVLEGRGVVFLDW